MLKSRPTIEENNNTSSIIQEEFKDETRFQKTLNSALFWTKTDHFYTPGRNYRETRKPLRLSTDMQYEKIEPSHPKSTSRSMERTNYSLRKQKTQEAIEKQVNKFTSVLHFNLGLSLNLSISFRS